MPDQITNIYQLFQKFPWSSFLDINEENNYIKIVDSDGADSTKITLREQLSIITSKKSKILMF